MISLFFPKSCPIIQVFFSNFSRFTFQFFKWVKSIFAQSPVKGHKYTLDESLTKDWKIRQSAYIHNKSWLSITAKLIKYIFEDGLQKNAKFPQRVSLKNKGKKEVLLKGENAKLFILQSGKKKFIMYQFLSHFLPNVPFTLPPHNWLRIILYTYVCCTSI